MNINYFSSWSATNYIWLPETIKVNISAYIRNHMQSFEQRVLPSQNGLIFIMDLNSQNTTCWIFDITFKSRKQGHNNNDSEFLTLSVSPLNSLGQTLNNLILKSHEELILNIDEFLRVFNELNISIMYGSLMLSVPDPDTPLRCTSTHLESLPTDYFARTCLDQELRETLLTAVEHVLQLLAQC